MNKTSLKRNSGITLIALIITIVVLLILAAVAIGTLEESNIIGRAKETTALYETRKAEEEQELATAEEFMKQYGKTEKRYYIIEDGCKYIYILTSEDELIVVVEENGQEIGRNSAGKIEYVDITSEIINEIGSASEKSINISDYSKAIRFKPETEYIYMLISKDGENLYIGDVILKKEENNNGDNTSEKEYKFTLNELGEYEVEDNGSWICYNDSAVWDAMGKDLTEDNRYFIEFEGLQCINVETDNELFASLKDHMDNKIKPKNQFVIITFWVEEANVFIVSMAKTDGSSLLGEEGSGRMTAAEFIEIYGNVEFTVTYGDGTIE